MKLLWVVCVGSVLVATVSEAQEASSTSEGTAADEATQGGSTAARSRAIGGTNQNGNGQTRFISPGALNALVGAGSSLLSGILGGGRPQRPINFGGRPNGFGGRPNGFGGNRPQCFGNNCFGNQGFGNQGFGNPGFGNPGFGNPGFGNPGFGNQGFGNQGFQQIGFGNQGFGFGGKRGRCPPVRSQCPRNFVQSQQPVGCQNDFQCSGIDKCCRDACIPFPVCKPPV